MPTNKSVGESLIPVHGGYRHLKGFQIAQLAFDVTRLRMKLRRGKRWHEILDERG